MEPPPLRVAGSGFIIELKAIQWQPGAGNERLDQWYGLLRKTLASGKALQVDAQPDEVDELVRHIGSRGLLVVLQNASHDDAWRLSGKFDVR